MSYNTTNKIGLINLPEMPESADNAIKNLTDAPTQNVGKTFADLWYLVFGGITQAADKKKMSYAVELEKYHQELTNSIESIPESKRTEPSIQVTAQALETSKYCVSSEALRKMFVNLISGSMNTDTHSLAHPAFPEILKQLSTDDALLLKDIYTSKQPALPIASLGIGATEGGYTTFYENIFVPENLDFSCPKCSLSLASLERANLISISYTSWLTSDSAYDKLRKTPEYLQAQEISTSFQQSSPRFEKGLLKLTALGRALCFICIGKR